MGVSNNLCGAPMGALARQFDGSNLGKRPSLRYYYHFPLHASRYRKQRVLGREICWYTSTKTIWGMGVSPFHKLMRQMSDCKRANRF